MEPIVADMYPDPESDDEEPSWVQEERDDFTLERDHNGDGKLDRKEITDWVLPNEDEDYVKEEAAHLLKEADDNEVCNVCV